MIWPHRTDWPEAAIWESRWRIGRLGCWTGHHGHCRHDPVPWPPTAPLMTAVQVPVGGAGAGPYALVAGPDETLWITLIHAGQIARLKPGGLPELHQLDPATCRPSQIVTGADGALWFTRSGDDRIGRITVDGEESSFPVGVGNAPFGITVGPDNQIWFTAMGTDRIGRITGDGDLTWVDLPIQGAMASMLTVGPDGGLWVTLNQAHALAHISIGDGRARIHPLPTPGAGPVGIAAGAHAVWFVEIVAGQVGYIDRTGHIHELALPDREARPHAILADADHGIWFTEWATSRVGHILQSGDLHHIALPPGSEPHGLTVGPDHKLWVALESGSIARLHEPSH